MRRSGTIGQHGLLLGLVSAATMLVLGPAHLQAANDTPKPAALIHPAFDQHAAERLERRRAVKAGRLRLPLPGTPDTERPLSRLSQTGVALGARMMIRAFKVESEIEVWVEKNGIYVPFATYPICYWSGTLGPKLREGDRQTPEGFYTITSEQLHFGGRWRRSLDVGFPNVFDRVNGRSGSAILIHGGCDSVGCLAMTDAVSAELYDLVSASLQRGARHVPVHIFPFRMTEANLAARGGGGKLSAFWQDLKLAYDAFERTRLPPRISVCGRRYSVEDGTVGANGATRGVEICPEDIYMTLDRSREERADSMPKSKGIPPHAKSRMGQEMEPPAAIPCSTALPSCRRWVALRERRASGAVADISKPVRASAQSKVR